MQTKYTPPEFAEAIKDLDQQTDRGKAIIAASILEELLREAIQARLLTLSSSARGRVFGRTLSSFQAKNDIGLAIGILSDRMHADLETFREIRNRFAHRITPLRFVSADIQALCATLLEGGETILTVEQKAPEARFMVAFVAVGLFLLYIRRLPMRLAPIGWNYPNLATDIAGLLPETTPDGS